MGHSVMRASRNEGGGKEETIDCSTLLQLAPRPPRPSSLSLERILLWRGGQRGEPSELCGVDLAHIFESTLSFPSFSSNTNRIQLQHNDKTSQPNGPTQKSCKWCGAPPLPAASLQCRRRHYTVIYLKKVHSENSSFSKAL